MKFTSMFFTASAVYLRSLLQRIEKTDLLRVHMGSIRNK